MIYEDAAKQAAVAADELDAMAAVLEPEPGLRPLAQKLRNRVHQTRDDRFQVLVLGEFKRGKSTLLNALLGADVLPAKVPPCTAVITKIRYGETPRVRITFIDERPEEQLSPDEFRRLYELKVGSSDDVDAETDRFANVDHASIEYPIELCRQRVELTDSPGLGEHVTRTRKTEGFLGSADAVVFVLDATQLLTQDECHFLEVKLLPRGLRNIFFVVNKWNMIDEMVLRPEEGDEQRRELNERMHQRLAPFCLIDGRDRTNDRIFRVNALGALKGRLRPSLALLEESNVPAFEAALQTFLLEDRARAKNGVILALARTTTEAVGKFVRNQVALADKSLGEVEAERRAVEPKLERLEGIRDHILNYLRAQSATLQDRLIVSLQQHTRKIESDLPQEIEQFNLDPITQSPVLWKVISDWSRREENKFRTQIRKCLEPQLVRMLDRRYGEWKLAVLNFEMKAVAHLIDENLQAEAKEYLRVMAEIEHEIGFHSSLPQIKDQVARWLGADGLIGTGAVRIPTVTAIGDVAGIIFAGIAFEIVADLVFHVATGGLGIIITLAIATIRAGLREAALRKQIREKVSEAVQKALREMELVQAQAMRASIQKGFDGLEQTIVGNINEEIAIVRAALDAIVEKKKHAEYSASAEKLRLGELRAAAGQHAERLRGLLAVA